MAEFIRLEDYEQIHRPVSGDTVAVIETDFGDIKIRLFPKQCPVTCENFIGLAQRHFYDGSSFHRVIKNFMIQGGDPEGDGTGGHSLWGGNIEDEFERNLFNFRGALSMANIGRPGTNGSQFFIVQAKSVPAQMVPQMEELIGRGFTEDSVEDYKTLGGTPWLDFRHTVFGFVYEGMDVVDAIAEVEVGAGDMPKTDVLIESIELV